MSSMSSSLWSQVGVSKHGRLGKLPKPAHPHSVSSKTPARGQATVGPRVWQAVRERFDRTQQLLAQEHQQVLALLEGHDSPATDFWREPQEHHVIPEAPKLPPQPPEGGQFSDSTSFENMPQFSEERDIVRAFDDSTPMSTSVPPYAEQDSKGSGAPMGVMSESSGSAPSGDAKKTPVTGQKEKYSLRPYWNDSRFAYHERTKGSQASASPFSLVARNTRSVTSGSDGTGEGAKIVTSRIIVHPNDYKRATWDLLSMGLVLYDMVMVPFSFFQPEQNTFLLFMSWFTRMFWSCDIGFSFMSGFITNSGDIEMRAFQIARKYLRSWFGLDVFVVSLDWIDWFIVACLEGGLGIARLGNVTRVFRMLKIVRLLRMAKANAIMSLLAGKFASEELLVFLEVFKLVVIMVSGAHCTACGFYAIGMDGTEDRSWPELFGYSDLSLRYRYIMSLRWGLSQFAGGMDEVQPVSFSEHAYSACVFMFAFWMGSAILSYLTSHVMHLDHLANYQSHQLSQISMFLNHHNISKELGFRVIRKAKHTLRMQRQRLSEEACGIHDLVSMQLLAEVHFEMYWSDLNTHSFFKEFVTYNAHIVQRVCHDAMSSHVDAMGDAVFHCGENADAMIIISSGEVSYEGEGQNEKVCCSAGTWFSEAVLWTTWAHHGTLTVVEDTQCSHLSALHFAKVMSQFDVLKYDVIGYATGFLEKLSSIEGPATDLPVVINALRNKRQGGPGKSQHTSESLAPRFTFLPAGSRSRSRSEQEGSGGKVHQMIQTLRGSLLSLHGAARPLPQKGEVKKVVPDSRDCASVVPSSTGGDSVLHEGSEEPEDD